MILTHNIILFNSILEKYQFTLDNYDKDNDNYIINIIYNNKPIKIITDFNIFLIAYSDDYDLSYFNNIIIYNNKTPDNILSYLHKNLINKSTEKILDLYHLSQNIATFSKVNINYNKLSNMLNNNILLQDIKNINNNNNYVHYIEYINNVLITTINKLVKFKLIVNESYPLTPPVIELISPHFTLEFSVSFMSLDILKVNKWYKSITLEQLILEIAKINFNDYIINNNNYNEFEFELIKLLAISDDNVINKIELPINIVNMKNDNNSKYWKSGTGYSSSRNISNNNKSLSYHDLTITILSKICEMKIEEQYIDILCKYINNKIVGLTLLELYLNINIYILIFDILFKLYYIISSDTINMISINLKDLYENLELVLPTDSNPNIKKIYDIIKLYNPPVINNIILNNDNEYINVMKDLQFGTYKLPSYHKFYNKLNEKINKKSMIRILSEISSLKNNLPLSHDSTIWIRIPDNCYNIFTVLISGPENTPYENGLFEFHFYLSNDYPQSPPQVLLYTTGNNTVRFNPNLYNNGKVCLSLLGTWEGGNNENWIPETSTILQVIVSIQSLIFIEEPYYNEPGYETFMGTEIGNSHSLLYNKNLYPNTIKYAIIDMIENPPQGFELIVNNHFKLKKEHIIKTINKWKEINNNIDINDIMKKIEI